MSELSPEFNVVMAMIRDRITPNKAAAISAILLSEMEDGDQSQVERLDRAFGWICEEVQRIDESAGVRMKLALNAVRETLDSQGYNTLSKDKVEALRDDESLKSFIETERQNFRAQMTNQQNVETSLGIVTDKPAWGDPDAYNAALKKDEEDENAEQ